LSTARTFTSRPVGLLHRELHRAQPAYEFAESEAKARGVLRAVELAMEQPDWP
jgi:hypothetical protein